MKGSKGFLILGVVVIIIAIPVIYFILKGKTTKLVISKQNQQRKKYTPVISDKRDNSFKQDVPDIPVVPFKLDVPITPSSKPFFKKEDIGNNLTIDEILKKEFEYKDNSVLTYSNFDPEKVNKIVKAIKEYKKPYFTLNKKSKFEIIDKEDEGEDILKIKEYIKEQDEYVKNLPENEKLMLQAYVSSDYQVFNKFLSKRKPILNSILANGLDFEKIRKSDSKIINEMNPRILMNYFSTLLNKVIYGAPRLPISLSVFRGSKDPYFLKELTLDENNVYTYKINTFLSTSLMPNIAAGLNQQFLDYRTQCCMSIINLPKDIHALFKYSSNSGLFGMPLEELEILLPPGGELKLVGYTPKYTEYEVGFDDDDNVFDTTPEIDTYVWDYIPPKNDDYTIELYRYRDMY